LAAVGVALWVVPELSLLVIIYLIALALIVTGFLQFILAWRLRKEYDHDWVLVLVGLVSIGFGIVLMANPEGMTEFVLVLVGIFLVAFGILQLVHAFRLRRFEALDAGEGA
jgi:uncharacterized membrane protein HdeD (DUF308 family)